MLHLTDILTGATHTVGGVLATSGEVAADELDALKAAILGVVEGVTEYLPISSTGHLLVVERLLDVGQTDATKDAADTYTITIQAGAILAVLVLYWHRIRAMAAGVVGRDPVGRKLAGALLAAFVPAAVVALAFEGLIKDHLFGAGPVTVAWVVGGVAILVFVHYFPGLGRTGHPVDAMTVRSALIVGLAQCLALWPGTSRSLVTIVAALALGYTMAAAVEFSFLLGVLTLTAATAYDTLAHGREMIDTFGLFDPLLGFVVAFLAAFVAVRWMVRYLSRHGLAIFGWYRIGVAAITIVLLATGVI